MATTQQLLDEAQSALHKLHCGTALVSVGHGDRRMEYAPADIGKLEAYVARLKRMLSGKPGRRRVTYVVAD